MKRSLVFALLLLLAVAGFADIYTIGTGTSATSTNPFYGSYNYSWSKIIYTQAEINAAGLTAASNIIGVDFYVGNTPSNYVMSDQRVYARHTAATAYETTDNTYPGTTGFTQLFQGTLTYNGGGWHYIQFTTPFPWNATQNIEFLFENWDGDLPTGYPTFRYTSTSPTYMDVYKGQDASFPGDLTGTRTYSRANIALITPQTTPPQPATLVYPPDGGTLISPASVLRWISTDGFPNGYRLSLGTDNPPTNLVSNQDLGNVTSYNPDPDLLINTTYYWKVVPYNTFGDAPNCPVWSFSTHGDATINQLPYLQHFDAVTAPDLPFDWTALVQSTAAAVCATYATSPYSAPNCSRLYNSTDADATVILVGPQIGTALNMNQIRVRFQGKGSAAYHLFVGVMTNPTDASTFVQLHDLNVIANWHEYVVSLAAYTGAGRYIAFKHGLGGTSRSIYLDDIIFEQIQPNDLACTMLQGNTTPTVNTATTYTASIYNWGTVTQDDYSVKLYDSNNVELATAPGLNVAPDQTVQVPIVWTPTVQGPMAIYAKVVLTGDQNPANDQSPSLNITVQPAGTVVVTIGEGNLNEGVPLEFYYKNSLFQCLYFPAEIGVLGQITALTFQNNFVTNLPNMPCKFWLGTTDLADLSAGWILPGAGNLTLVYDGNIDFPSGENAITIPLQTPYNYTGGNLVLYANRPMDTVYYSSSDNFRAQTVGTNRARKLYSDSTNYDPLNPSATGTLSGTFPMTAFSFVTAGYSVLNGTVTSGGNPLADVDVVINGTANSTTTNAIGGYNFPFVQPGAYTVTASKLGYETQTLPVTLIADETTTLDFTLSPSTTVTVSGLVVGSDQPTVGLADVQVTLDGAMDYTGTTNAQGQFSIPGVLSGNTYDYILVKLGYQDLTGTITVGTTPYDMGTLIMPEIALPPVQVIATENAAQTQVALTWRPPGSTGGGGTEDFEITDGGWVPTSNWTDPEGDWEWGNNYNVANFVDIDTYVDAPPPTAHSGTGMWGTVLHGGYTNCGGWSYLRKTFNLSGINDPVLSFWHYMDGYNTWDYGLIKVNGTTVWGTSSLAEFMPWQELTIDLSAYANQANVEIGFEWYATAVVSYAGWYIDDVYVGPAQDRVVNYVYSPVAPARSNLSETEGAAVKESRTLRGGRSTQNRNDRILTGYKVWRLTQGNEDNEASWTLLTVNSITDTAYVDTGWATLPDGNYRWAVKGVYTNNVLSVAAFSNMIPILRLDLSALSISGTTTPSVGVSSTYSVEIENTGTTTQLGTAYTVKLMAGATELASVPGQTIEPDESIMFQINWTPATPGPLALTGRVFLPGDAVPANDETAVLNISVMPAGVIAITVGDGSATEGRPVDFYYNNSLFQCLYFPSELNQFGSVTALTFYNNFVTNLPDKPTKIWLGETQSNDLSGGWILPPNLTQVYDGTITYPNGENSVTIPLQTPFNWTSGNLLLYANRPWEDVHYNTNDNFRVQTVGTNRARKLTSNTTNYDPNAPSAAGTLSGQFPMTTFHLTAIGTTPLFAVNPSGRDFGTVLINSTHAQEFTISNAGGGPLTISSIGIAGSPFFTLSGLPALPATIDFGENLTFTASYAPTAEGQHTATITVQDNMARLPHTLILAANCIDTTINTLPYQQNFDGVTPPALPVDWNSIVQSSATAAAVNTYASTTYSHSQPNCVRLLNSTDANATVLLIAPPYANTIPANNTRVRFWARSSGNGYPLSIGVMTDYTDASTYTEVQSIPLTTTVSEYLVTLAGYTGTGHTVAFKHGLGGTSRTLYLDDVMLEIIPDNDLAATALMGNTTPSVGMASTYTVSVFNWGTNAQNDYTVKLFDGNDVELASAPGTQCNPAQAVDIPVIWTPAAQGAMSIYGKVVLDGDQNNLNDETNPLSILVQPAGTLAFTVGDGNQTARIPIDMYYKNSLHQYLIYPPEIGNTLGQITGMAIYNQFTQDLMNMPVNVWLGTTTLADLSAGWVPVAGHTQVFSGTLNFPTGTNTITIPFNQPYMYLNGENLLLTFQRPMDTQYYNSTNYFKAQTGTPATRARNIYSDSTNYDPMNPPTTGGTNTGQFAQTTFYMIPGGVGHLNGTVTGVGGVPLEGVVVSFATGGYGTTTNAQGQYQIMNILPNTYTVNFNVYGYLQSTHTITIEEDETEVLDVAMQPMPTVTVSGNVIASDTGAGLNGAEIHLVGYANYNANTNAAGAFAIPSVYANQAYAYVIMCPGYTAAMGTINVGAANYNMGDIVLNEVAYAPHTLEAEVNTEGTAVDLAWQSPDPNAIEVTESFEADTFPPADWSQVITNTGPVNASGVYPTWCRVGSITISGSPVNPTDGSYQAGLWWDYAHQDEWLITPAFNCPPAGYLRFDSYVFLGSTNADHYYVKISMDNGNTWTALWDASAQTGGWNYYASPIQIDLSAYSGQQVKIAFNAVDGPSNDGLWYVWFIDDIYIGNAMMTLDAPVHISFGPDQLETRSAGNGGFALSPVATTHPSRRMQEGGIRTEPSLPLPHEIRHTGNIDRILTGYRLWRLSEGQEGNEASWSLLTPTDITVLNHTDPGWQTLPNGSYRWAVKAVYTAGVLSVPSFSNILIKEQETGMIAGLVRRTNTTPIAGATVTAGDFSATTNNAGAYTLVVPIGTYDVTASATGFNPLTVEDVVVSPDLTTTVNFILTVVDGNDPAAPVSATALIGNYPNPFNPETTINFSVKEPGAVKIGIYNLKGQLVRALVHQELATGNYSAVFDGRDGAGKPLSSGVYYYRMSAPGYTSTRRMVLSK